MMKVHASIEDCNTNTDRALILHIARSNQNPSTQNNYVKQARPALANGATELYN